MREQIDALSVRQPKAVDYYTGSNTQILDLIESASRLSPDPVISSYIASYTSFLQGKERADLERAEGATGFAKAWFKAKTMDNFKRLIATQGSYNAVFLTQATESQKKRFNEFMASDIVQEVDRLREIAIEGGLFGNLRGSLARSGSRPQPTKSMG